MKINMLTDYKGPIGTFIKGQEYNVGASVAKRLPKDSWRELPAADTDDRQGGQDAKVAEAPTAGKKPTVAKTPKGKGRDSQSAG
jgi:hypothetical protein